MMRTRRRSTTARTITTITTSTTLTPKGPTPKTTSTTTTTTTITTMTTTTTTTKMSRKGRTCTIKRMKNLIRYDSHFISLRDFIGALLFNINLDLDIICSSDQLRAQRREGKYRFRPRGDGGGHDGDACLPVREPIAHFRQPEGAGTLFSAVVRFPLKT